MIEEQMYQALADTFVAQLDDKEIDEIESDYTNMVHPDLQVARDARFSLYKYQASNHLEIGKLCFELLLKIVPQDKMWRLIIVLRLMGYSIGNAMIFGGYNAIAPFTDMARYDREAALNRIKVSWFSELRQLYRVFNGVSILYSYGLNLDPSPHMIALKVQQGGITAQNCIKDSETFEPLFLDIAGITHENKASLKCDVLVIGSGCGGSVVAKELSEVGYDVILVDKGEYYKPSDQFKHEKDGAKALYENSCALYSEDLSMQVIAGSTFGGGSVVNWSFFLTRSASFQTPQNVRYEWEKRFGLKYVTTPEFQKSVDTVWKRIGCSSAAVEHNVPNQILMEGCSRLGYDCSTIDQNTAGQKHNCGSCGLSCPSRVKQSAVITWIKDASTTGCRFIKGFNVSQILHTNNIVYGAVGIKDGAELTIKAFKVIVSCGSMNTPNILKKSTFVGLNSHVGKNLKVHPVSVVSGIFPDRDVKPFQGSIMTSVSNIISNLDGRGYGAKIETPAAMPGGFAVTTPWESAKSHKRRMLLYPHTSQLIVLTRDKDSTGEVTFDKNGAIRYNWKLGTFDGKTILAGVEKCIEILLAAGAAEIYFGHQDMQSSFKRDLKNSSIKEILDSKEYKTYISKVRQLDPSKFIFFAAHQMSTCRMASTPDKGAVDSHGRLYGVKNLYIADASVLPTSTGVNPMVSTYSLAHSIAQFIKADLKEDPEICKL